MDLTFHESDERLELYALDRLSDSDVIRIEEHLLVCEVCRERLDESANFAFAMREELAAHPVPQRAFEKNWIERLTGSLASLWTPGAGMMPRFAMGGALALALVAFVVYRMDRPSLAPVASLQLTAMRGVDFKTVSPARELDLTFNDAAATGGQLSVEIVDSNGTAVWQGAPKTAENRVRARIAKELPAGEYYARLYDSPGHLVHEYGFRVK